MEKEHEKMGSEYKKHHDHNKPQHHEGFKHTGATHAKHHEHSKKHGGQGGHRKR